MADHPPVSVVNRQPGRLGHPAAVTVAVAINRPRAITVVLQSRAAPTPDATAPVAP